jgi:uncharacterized membrane protein
MNDREDAIRLLAQRLLERGPGELPQREKRVIERIARRVAVSRNLVSDFDERRTFGQRLADRVAELGGSWGFIIAFAVFIAGWAIVNAALALHAFDPYPYIFLNLMLSMLAAIQAPIIMMSQNRQAAKDREAAEHDYEVNLKAEIEIAALHEKLDQIRHTELALLCERTLKAIEAKE